MHVLDVPVEVRPLLYCLVAVWADIVLHFEVNSFEGKKVKKAVTQKRQESYLWHAFEVNDHEITLRYISYKSRIPSFRASSACDWWPSWLQSARWDKPSIACLGLGPKLADSPQSKNYCINSVRLNLTDQYHARCFFKLILELLHKVHNSDYIVRRWNGLEKGIRSKVSQCEGRIGWCLKWLYH